MYHAEIALRCHILWHSLAMPSGQSVIFIRLKGENWKSIRLFIVHYFVKTFTSVQFNSPFLFLIGQYFRVYAVGRRLPSNTAMILLTAISPILVRVSIVADAMCGTITTLSSSARPGSSCGSRSNTSRPAPHISPLFSACASAFSSTTGPRDVLMSTAVSSSA